MLARYKLGQLLDHIHLKVIINFDGLVHAKFIAREVELRCHFISSTLKFKCLKVNIRLTLQ